MKNFAKAHASLIVELTLALLGVVTLYFLLAIFAPGGPLSTDVIGYANVGIAGLREPAILNRYFHVFLQLVFIKLAPTPLAGMQDFWAFLIAGTCGLIYLAARTFSHHSHVLHGLLAVGLFLSINEIADTAGITHVDITAMFMMMLFTVTLILSARLNHRSIGLLMLLGFLLYLAFRTKETTLVVGIPLLGLGMAGEKPFDWRQFLRKLLYVFIGILLGVIFFILLDVVFLHDPWFGFRLSELHIFFSNYVGNLLGAEKIPGSTNWYTEYLFAGLLLPFTLYVISAAKTAREQEAYPGLRLVWLIPLAVITFVILAVNSQWGLAPRYVLTILPFICFLGPQYLNLDLSANSSNRQRLWAVLIFVIGLALTVIVRLLIRVFMPRLGWDIASFLAIVFIPILFSIILAFSFYWKAPSQIVSSLMAVLIIAIIAIPLVTNAKTVVLVHPNQNESQNLFYPFSAFPDQIHYTQGMNMYVSLNTFSAVSMSTFVKDRSELSALFNVYFAAGSTKTNFTLASDSVDMAADLLQSNFNYALISRSEWNDINQDSLISSQLDQRYQVILEDRNLVVLLKPKVSR